jgi:hypothetical protein
MKKIFKRILKVTLLAIAAGILTIAIIILFPQQLVCKERSAIKISQFIQTTM